MNTMLSSRNMALRFARQNRIVQNTSRGFSTKWDNEAKGRPTSPHIMIYAFPINAISSITTRVTGGLLTVGVYGIGIGALAGVDMTNAMAVLGASAIGPLVKFSVAFPFTYHFMGAIRHFYWEKNPDGLTVETQEKSSIALFGASGIASAFLMFI